MKKFLNGELIDLTPEEEQVKLDADAAYNHPDAVAVREAAISLDAQVALETAIEAAATLEELKAALLGQNVAGKVIGRPA